MFITIQRTVFLGLLFCAVISGNPATAQSKNPQQVEADTLNAIESLVSFANKHLHIPYRSGGSSKKGFDCSGFVRYCFSKWDISLPHSSAAQSEKGEEIDLSKARKGDLIFFKGQSSRDSRIGHVGIITETAPGYIRFIHSAFNGGVRYDLLSADYYQKRFVAIRRMIN